ncbi:hypothetical protein GA0115280_112213 [Streptomyces sp. Cmuel-A718b]|nr:hypothetical protein GA0115280_112213 [Streptomyces sp. Cmuel-A718b]
MGGAGTAAGVTASAQMVFPIPAGRSFTPQQKADA